MIDLVYIAGPSYSGSTLLTFLLNAHPAVGTIGELKWGTIDLETYRCSCGALLRACPFWSGVGADVRESGLPFELERPETDFRFRAHPLTDRLARARNRGRTFERFRDAAMAVLPASRRNRSTIAAINRAVIQAVLRRQQAACFLDASKDPVRLRHLLATGDYAVRMIQLLRDGRGVTCSTIKNKCVSAEEAASDWAKTHEQIERIGEELGQDGFLAVRYEDLCADVTATCERIFAFIGVDPSGAARDYRAVEHHILGNSMRLRAGSEIRLDESWRSLLPAKDLATFERVAGERNRTYGYT
ncbi:MAG: sulfotransferase [Phycisphaerae bacterium]